MPDTQPQDSEWLDDAINGSLHQISTRALRGATVYVSHVSIAKLTLKESIRSHLAGTKKQVLLGKIEELTTLLNDPRDYAHDFFRQDIKKRISELEQQFKSLDKENV